jgi:hypothetical protein
MTTMATQQQTPPWLPNFAAYAGILPAPILGAPKIHFVYSTNYAAGFPGSGDLAASAPGQKNQIQIQNDGHFLIVAINGRVTNTDDTTLVSAPVPILIDLSDTSGQQWDDGPVHWDNLVGLAQAPLFLPYPKLALKGTNITILLTNLAATARHVRLSFVGFKVLTDWVPAYARAA